MEVIIMKGTYYLGNKTFETKEMDLPELQDNSILGKI